MFSINPGHMGNEMEYNFHAKLMYDIVNNYENYKSGESFWIRDGISLDILEKFMASQNKNTI